MLKNLLERFFSNSLVHIFLAVSVGVAAMILLFLFYDQVWTDTPEESEEVSEPAAGSDGAVLIAGEVIPIHISSVPVPFVGGTNGAPLGYVFVDITLEVIGEPAFQKANAALETMELDFTAGLRDRGAGMVSRPGVVDYDRLAAEFLALAEVQVGKPGVARVVIRASEEN